MLQNDLDGLSVWEDPSKCQVVRVTTTRKSINIMYKLHGQVLEVVTRAKYLGVDISSGISRNSHIQLRSKIFMGSEFCHNYLHTPG